jgi:hypothetical protein
LRPIDVKVYQEGDVSHIIASVPGASIHLEFTDEDAMQFIHENFDEIMNSIGDLVEQEYEIMEFVENFDDNVTDLLKDQ